jgi:hypothetical protein
MISLVAHLEQDVKESMLEALQEAEKDAKATPFFKDSEWGLGRPGPHLRDSIFFNQTSFNKGELVADRPYAKFVEAGTLPHAIVGRSGNFLRFEWRGEMVMFRYVNHPGTEARPFMAHAADTGERVLRMALNSAVNASVARSNSK